MFAELKDTELWLSGDGRCDSPGHNAKYGTYTMIDQQSEKIVDFQIVQVSEVTSSNAMEREGFKRCMDNIQERGAHIEVVATDWHVSIKSDMKKNYPDIDLQFDVWHLAKSALKNALKRQRKRNAVNFPPGLSLYPTICGGVPTLVRGTKNCYVRSGFLLSTTLRTFTIGAVQICIMNVPTHLSQEMWLRPGSPAHEALKEVVLTKISSETFNS